MEKIIKNIYLCSVIFFMVLDLRLIRKIGGQAWLPFFFIAIFFVLIAFSIRMPYMLTNCSPALITALFEISCA